MSVLDLAHPVAVVQARSQSAQAASQSRLVAQLKSASYLALHTR